jgi:3-oxoacyl-[acyl-carrier protein] reductase
VRFSGKVALMTGAGRNIRATIARSLGAGGAVEAGGGIDSGSAEETAGQIRAAGGRKTDNR